MKRALWPLFAPYSLISAVHVGCLLGDSEWTYPTKLLLMPALAFTVTGAALLGAKHRARLGVMALLLAAIVASWLGDGAGFFFPMLGDELPAMIACFGLAHVLYMIAFARRSTRGFDKRGVLGYGAAYVALMALLVPHAGSLALPVMVYGLVLAGTALFALRVNRTVAWGGWWFLVSDAVLAFRVFWPDPLPEALGAVVMSTYTAGQGLIAYGMLRRLYPART